MTTARPRRRAAALLESLVSIAVFTLASVGTLALAGQSRSMRAAASDRAVLAMLAQEELDRLRLDGAPRAAGTTPLARDTWPTHTSGTLTLSAREDGLWLAEVRVQRAHALGSTPVQLATILPEARP